jgi:hypothetical protein
MARRPAVRAGQLQEGGVRMRLRLLVAIAAALVTTYLPLPVHAASVRPATPAVQGATRSVTDQGPPFISITSPDPNAQYVAGPGSGAVAQYSCFDPSGIASCTGSVPNGAFIDMSRPCFCTFTVNAVSVSGKKNSMSILYIVLAGE